MIPDNYNPRRVMTVLGAIDPNEIGLCDAHSHVWIERVPGGDRNAPQLLDEKRITERTLKEYRDEAATAPLSIASRRIAAVMGI